MGILHHTEGTVIEMVGGTFRVAEACAGLRFLIATIAIGALFSYLNFRKWYKIAIYMLASAIVPVVANGFRALGIVLLAYFSNNKIATGADHLVYGWGFSVAILCLLMVVGVRFADPVPEAGSCDGTPAKNPSRRSFVLATALFAIAAITAAPAYAYWNEHRLVSFNKAALSGFVPTGAWTRTAASGHWSPQFLNPDAAVRFGLQSKLGQVPHIDVTIYYYARTRNGHGLISSTNAIWDEEEWHAVAQTNKRVNLGGKEIVVREETIASQRRTELVWWTYWSNGEFTTSAMKIKLGGLKSVIGSPGGSALIALSTDVDSDNEHASARLDNALAALGDLPRALNLAAEPRDRP